MTLIDLAHPDGNQPDGKREGAKKPLTFDMPPSRQTSFYFSLVYLEGSISHTHFRGVFGRFLAYKSIEFALTGKCLSEQFGVRKRLF